MVQYTKPQHRFLRGVLLGAPFRRPPIIGVFPLLEPDNGAIPIIERLPFKPSKNALSACCEFASGFPGRGYQELDIIRFSRSKVDNLESIMLPNLLNLGVLLNLGALLNLGVLITLGHFRAQKPSPIIG